MTLLERFERIKKWLLISILVFVVIVFVISFVSCNNGGPPPEPPPPASCGFWGAVDNCVCPEGAPYSSVLKVCAPPRVDRPIDWHMGGGITAFSLALRDVTYIKEFTYHAQRHGWTILRVGAQTSHDWCRPRDLRPLIRNLNDLRTMNNDLLYGLASAGYLPCGPAHGTPEWEANLTRMLDVTARVHNMWVQLIPTFTYKSYNEGSQAANIEYFNDMFDRVNAVVSKGNYKHVVYELFNEVVHPLSQHIKDEDVREMFLHARTRTTLPLGTDYHGGRADDVWRGRYPFAWRDVSDYLAFHTPRNPEPTFTVMEDIQDKFNYCEDVWPGDICKQVWVDETVCWASQASVDKYNLEGKGTVAMRGYGTSEQRMRQVETHLKDIRRVGWKPFFHSIWGIECTELGRLPRWEELN